MPPSLLGSVQCLNLFCSAPILIIVAVLTLVFGRDHPAGKWSERHNIPATALAIKEGHDIHYDPDEKHSKEASAKEVEVSVSSVEDRDAENNVKSTVDVAVNESLTARATLAIVANPLTWLPSLAYLTTFGLELLIDAKMADVLFTLFKNKVGGFNQTKAGYYTSIL